ncbi:hypothetical protein [Luteolibacter sp. LG18]|uniref:hypothetical protein n=1 Tax=Luteolibacter sp. LG18 TaxID=2819286 RepID=UPI002B306B9B|nr:hypothetical protein llg_07370 [Luteolibacter sp. LG18]BCU79634.1 hypothetical protein llg_43490 [Luteolibacter sp. LG18]
MKHAIAILEAQRDLHAHNEKIHTRASEWDQAALCLIVVDDCEQAIELLKRKSKGKLTDEDKALLAALWKAAPKMARQRNSKHEVEVAWLAVPVKERPTQATILAALAAWCQCEQWKKDGGAYIRGLARWIKDRMWIDPPEIEQAASRYRPAPKPEPAPAEPHETATVADIKSLTAAVKRGGRP